MINLHTPLGKMGKLVAFASATGAVVYQPFRPLVFQGQSMEPTYKSGEYAITMPTSGDLKVGDIVVVEMPDGPIVKRVAYLPGQSFTQAKNASGWNDLVDLKKPTSKMRSSGRYREFTVPEGYVYVLGDNRTISMDSRDFGPVPLDWVKRKVFDPRDFDPNKQLSSTP